VAEQRYQCVVAVVGDGLAVSPRKWGYRGRCCRPGLARYEAEGLAGVKDRSHRPTDAEVEAMLLELRRSRPSWGRVGWCSSWPNSRSISRS
jgi:leucine-zipper of insertion element IS481